MKVPATFVKLMMLTTSEHDHEALVAIRKANAMLAQANVNWEEFLTAVEATRSQAAPPKPQTKSPSRSEDFSDVGMTGDRYTDADTINRLFEACFSNTPRSSSFREFLDSVHTFWEINGYLSKAQYEAIQRSAQRQRRRF
jgi:hypothetical protein